MRSLDGSPRSPCVSLSENRAWEEMMEPDSKKLLIFLSYVASNLFSLERVMSCPFCIKPGTNMKFFCDF